MSNNNDVIEFPKQPDPQNLPVTREAVERLKAQRELLREYVRSQLRVEVDYGQIPGTDRNTLYKPGAEKLAQLFGFGVKVVLSDRLIERDGNFAMFTYRAEVYPLRAPDLVIATCEGSCNSQEKKYAERNEYEWVDYTKPNGEPGRKRVSKGVIATPVTDVLNTLIKMAQKRAYVGAIILATGASDFFTQDIDGPEDAEVLGIAPKQEPARAKVSVPGVKSAASQSQQAPVQMAAADKGIPSCELCGSMMRLSRNGDAYTCPNWKDKSKGDHSYVHI